MKNTVRSVAAVVLTLAVGAGVAQASGGRYRDFVIGERASGMGGAGIAIAKSVDAIYLNPAGLTGTQRDSLSLSANLYGFESFRHRDAMYPGEDASSSSFVTIPTAVGIVRRLSDQWVGGFGVFTPENGRVDIITSKANGTHLYTENYTDQTLWFGPAFGWGPQDGRWSLGGGLFGAYRSSQFSQSLYRDEDSLAAMDAYDADDTGVLAVLAAQCEVWNGWRAGMTLQSPNLHVYGTGKRSVLVGTDAVSAGYYTDDVDTDNRQALQLGIGIGKSVPGQWAVALDMLYHDKAHYDMMSWDFHALGVADQRTVRMDRVFDASAGAEIFLSERWPLRFGLFTAFNGSEVSDKVRADDAYDTDVDLYGFTCSLGRETDNMAVNVGIEYAFGTGHTYGFKRDETTQEVVAARTKCREEVILFSVSTSYFF